MQRLAVYVSIGLSRSLVSETERVDRSRTFMRSVVSDDSNVGLLLFDEPSASLDPTAEHGELFYKAALSTQLIACNFDRRWQICSNDCDFCEEARP